jgi:hypothetical protein
MNATTPTLPQIRDYQPTHLLEAAPYWQEQADHWRFHTGGALRDLDSMGWTGLDAQASIAHTTALHTAAQAASGPVDMAAQLMPSAATDLDALKSQCMTIVAWCTEGGFTVSDNLKVKDPLQGLDYATILQRDKIAAWLEGMLKTAATNLAAQDQAVASVIDAHYATLAGVRHADSRSVTGHVQAVDSRSSFGVDPVTGDPIPDPPTGHPPDGKQWWYHVGSAGGWQLQDHLKQCTGMQQTGDLASIAGGVVAAPGLPSPGSVLAEINAGRGMWDINHCEAP